MDALSAETAEYLDQLVSTAQVPSYALAINSHGRLLYSFGGNSGAKPSSKPDFDTRFAVYSITKAATALATLRLAQRGCLDLQSPVATYLDGWVEPFRDDVSQVVRVIHLLSHTAGFTYGSRGGPVADAYRRSGFIRSAPKSISPRDMYSRFSRLPRLYSPGQGWSYSLASDVLGWVLSEVSAAPLEEVLQTEVFSPLAMTRTCLYSELQEDHDVGLVYEHGLDGWQPAYSAMTGWGDPHTPPSGGASMVTTLRDAMRLASTYVNENPEFLSPELRRLANTNLIPRGASLRSGLLSPFPGRTIDGVGYSTGVAVIFDDVAAGIPGSLGEVGWEGSTGCFFFANRRLGLYAAFMTNILPNASMPWWLELRKQIYGFHANN